MSTDVSAPFPEIVLPPGATITVTLDDVSAIVDRLNVYGFTPARQEVEDVSPIAPLFSYGANE